jgi:sugar phosphate isomerase/epimerase
MKYSVFTVCMPDYTVEHAIGKLAEWGYDGVEWRVTNQSPSASGKPSFWQGNLCTITLDEVLQRGASVRKLCEKARIEIVELAAYVKCHDLANVEKVFEACSRMGTKQARVGVPGYDGLVPYRKLFDEAQKHYAQVEKLARRTGVRALVEIHMGTILPSVSSAYRFVSGFDPACVGVIHDAGNMAVEGFENYRMGMELLGEYLALVHVKNAKLVKGDAGPAGVQTWKREWAELREGFANWADLIRAMKAVGYDGWLSLEDFTEKRSTEEKMTDAIGLLRELERTA